MHALLQGFERQLEAIKADAIALTTGLRHVQFNWRPREGSWSIAECLGHLNIVGRQDALPTITRMIRKLQAKGRYSDGPYRRLWFGEVLIRLGEPPVRVLRAPTLKRLVPPPDQPLAQVVPPFPSLQDDLLARAREASGLDLGAVWARTPTLIRLTLGQWFSFALAHERRHLWQARNVASRSDFPRV